MLKILAISIVFFAIVPEGLAAEGVPTPAPRGLTMQGADADTNQAVEEKAEPESKPERVYQSACPAVFNGRVIAKPLPPISEDRCGERSPLEVTEVSGVQLSASAVMNCRTATAMAEWVESANETASLQLGSEIKQVITSTSYQCRRRNNALTGKISEHGFANAIDILGFRFSNGEAISLIKDWGPTLQQASEEEGEITEESSVTPESQIPPSKEGIYLRAVRDLACEHFTTVLSPESNELHADHFHFDLGCHGKTCTYKICE